MKLKLILTTAIVGLVASLLGAAAPARADPFAYVTNFLGSSVSQYDIGAGGLLAPLSPATVATTGGKFGVAVSPDGRSVYVTGSDSVSQFDVGAGGALSPKSPATVASGVDPEGIAVSPDGQSAYVANVSSDSVSQYDVGAGGALSPKNPATVAAGAFSTQVAVSPDGGSAYVTNFFGDSVSQYGIGAGGLLAPLSPATVATGSTPPGVASAPRGVAVSPDGGSVYVANEAATASPSTTSARAGRFRRRARPRWPPVPPRTGWR